MKNLNKFVQLADIDPVAAMQLLPGVKLQISRRTFAQIAAVKFDTLKAQNVTVAKSLEPSIDKEQAQIVHAAAMVAAVRSKGE